MGGEVLKTSPPTFRSAIKTTQINSKSLKVETACALSVSGVVSVVQAAMQRVSGDVEVSRVLPESAVITPSLPVRWGSSIELRQRQDDLMDLCD